MEFFIEEYGKYIISVLIGIVLVSVLFSILLPNIMPYIEAVLSKNF